MHDNRHVIALHMSALIRGQFSCLDSAANDINLALGRRDNLLSKGTLSRRAAGSLGWPIDEVFALEDIARVYPVSDMRARQIGRLPQPARASIPEVVGLAAKEHGEAAAAALKAFRTERSEDLDIAIVEAEEMVAAAQAQLDALIAQRMAR